MKVPVESSCESNARETVDAVSALNKSDLLPLSREGDDMAHSPTQLSSVAPLQASGGDDPVPWPCPYCLTAPVRTSKQMEVFLIKIWDWVVVAAGLCDQRWVKRVLSQGCWRIGTPLPLPFGSRHRTLPKLTIMKLPGCAAAAPPMTVDTMPIRMPMMLRGFFMASSCV